MQRSSFGWFDNLEVDIASASPRRWDWIILGVLVTATVAEWIFFPYTNQLASAFPALAAFAVLPVRRQIPLLAALVANLAEIVADISAYFAGTVSNSAYGHFGAALIIIYALCRWAKPKEVAIGMVTILFFLVVDALIVGIPDASDMAFLGPWLVLALFALAMRYRARLAASHDAHIRLAERNALARELHDSVAHHVSAIAVQAQAAQFIATSNPDAAAKAMGDVEAIANDAIDEMRRMVGILRSDQDHARTVASTTLDEFNNPTGKPRVVVVGESDLSSLPMTVAAAIYRITQESVTNATRHSRDVTFVDITLTTNDLTASLEIINDGTPTTRNAGGGYGLIGMNERVESLGGTITTGRRPGSGWCVSAQIPLSALDLKAT